MIVEILNGFELTRIDLIELGIEEEFISEIINRNEIDRVFLTKTESDTLVLNDILNDKPNWRAVKFRGKLVYSGLTWF
jgi:hypothetical protein